MNQEIILQVLLSPRFRKLDERFRDSENKLYISFTIFYLKLLCKRVASFEFFIKIQNFLNLKISDFYALSLDLIIKRDF